MLESPFKTGSSQSGCPLSQCRSFTSSAQVSPSLRIFPDSGLPTLLICHSLPTTRVEVPLLCALMALGLCCSKKEDGRKGKCKDSFCLFSFLEASCTSFPRPLFSFVHVSLGCTWMERHLEVRTSYFCGAGLLTHGLMHVRQALCL